MVFFTCNHCGESLKKAAVEKHYSFKSCRNAPIFLTCVDCLKDFREQEYVAHTKCITEAERYSAKGFVAKPERNKGAQKQEIWTECIQELSERPHFDRNTKNVLQRIAAQTNVPRKKPKFVNFLKSSMRYSPAQAEKVWTIIEEGLEEFKKKSAPAQSASKLEASPAEASPDNGTIENGASSEPNDVPSQSSAGKKRKNTDEAKVDSKKPKTEVSLADSTTDAKSDSTFDWQKNILRVFNKKQTNNQLVVTALRSKVIKKFLKTIGEDDSNSAQYEKIFKKKLKKVNELTTAEGIVHLKA